MIILQKDPAVQELKRITENDLKLKTTFVYANLFEANLDLDKVEGDSFPVFLFVATDVSREKTLDSGLIIRTIPVIGMMLDIMDTPTSEITSEQADEYINRMRMLGENMIFNLNKSEFTHKEQPTNDCTYDKILGAFDKNCVGVGMSFEWNFNTGVSGCYK